MVALVHSEALGCVRPSVLSRDRNSFCLCCSASPVPSPGSCDRSCTGPHSPCGTQSHPKKGFGQIGQKKVILFWSNVFFLLLIPPVPCTPPANLIIPKLQPHLPRTYPLPCACIPSVITDLQQTRFALAPAATDWGFPPTGPIPSPFGAATHPQCSLGKAGGRVWEQQL